MDNLSSHREQAEVAEGLAAGAPAEVAAATASVSGGTAGSRARGISRRSFLAGAASLAALASLSACGSPASEPKDNAPEPTDNNTETKAQAETKKPSTPVDEGGEWIAAGCWTTAAAAA